MYSERTKENIQLLVQMDIMHCQNGILKESFILAVWNFNSQISQNDKLSGCVENLFLEVGGINLINIL